MTEVGEAMWPLAIPGVLLIAGVLYLGVRSFATWLKSTRSSGDLPTGYGRYEPHEPNQPAPGWYPDPSGEHELRYWDGASWTNRVANSGRVLDGSTGRVTATVVPPPPESDHQRGKAGVWRWFIWGLLSVLLGTGVSVLAEPRWAYASELGVGAIAFVAPPALLVFTAGVWSGKNTGWSRKVFVRLWQGMAIGLAIVMAGAYGGHYGSGLVIFFGAPVMALMLEVPVFLLGWVVGYALERSPEPEEERRSLVRF